MSHTAVQCYNRMKPASKSWLGTHTLWRTLNSSLTGAVHLDLSRLQFQQKGKAFWLVACCFSPLCTIHSTTHCSVIAARQVVRSDGRRAALVVHPMYGLMETLVPFRQANAVHTHTHTSRYRPAVERPSLESIQKEEEEKIEQRRVQSLETLQCGRIAPSNQTNNQEQTEETN